MLIWWVASKSDTPRPWKGLQELMILPLKPPSTPTRSALELRSMDLE